MTNERLQTAAVTLLRLVAGLLLLQAGGLKVFGWFGGSPSGAPLPPQMMVGGTLEVIGGALLMLGLLTRPVAFVLCGQMAVAYFQFHQPKGTWPVQNHGEHAVLQCFINLFFAIHGGGELSVDRLIGKIRSQKSGT